MRSRRVETLICVIVVIVGVGCIAAMVANFLDRHRPNAEARREMTHLMRRLQLGDTPQRVRNTFTSGRYWHLELGTGKGIWWRVETPYELGSGNWLLYLEFHHDRVVALRLRTLDDTRFRPRDPSPRDRVVPNWKSPFPRWTAGRS